MWVCMALVFTMCADRDGLLFTFHPRNGSAAPAWRTPETDGGLLCGLMRKLVRFHAARQGSSQTSTGPVSFVKVGEEEVFDALP